MRNDQPVCPFCSAALIAVEPPAIPEGRRTRAAIFATLALAACGSAKPAPQKQEPAGSDDSFSSAHRQEQQQQFAQPVVDAGVPDAAVAARPRPDARVVQPDLDEIDERHNINRGHGCVNGKCMPYGAPPVRRRMV